MMMGLGLLVTIFVVILVIPAIGLITYLVSRGRKGENSIGNKIGRQQTPLDLLEQRYARGEISKAEFDQMRDDLS